MPSKTFTRSTHFAVPRPRISTIRPTLIFAPEGNPPVQDVLVLDPHHHELSNMGFTPEARSRFGIGFCKSGPLSGCITIPIRNVNGDIVGYAGQCPAAIRNHSTEWKVIPSRWRTPEVFNVQFAVQEPGSDPLVIVQDLLDCIRLWQSGVKRIIAPIGKKIHQSQLEAILWNFPPPTRFVLIYRENGPSRASRFRALRFLARHAFVRYVQFDDQEGRPGFLAPSEVIALIGNG